MEGAYRGREAYRGKEVHRGKESRSRIVTVVMKQGSTN